MANSGINSIMIENFKTLNKVNISNFKLINLIGGKNNVGKTTMLEALFMFYDRLTPIMVMRQFNRRGVHSFKVDNTRSFWEPLFHKYNIDNNITIEIKRKNGFTEKLNVQTFKDNTEYTVNLSNNMSAKNNHTDTGEIQNADLKLIYKSDKYEEEITLTMKGDQLGLNINHLKGVPNNRNMLLGIFLSSKNHSNPMEESERFGQLDLYDESRKITEFLKIMEPNLKSITAITTAGETMLHADVGLGRKVPIYYMGDGFVRLVSIILAIASAKDGFVIIDEIENGLHYSIMPQIWESISRAAKEYNCQLFISTHSYECLQAAFTGIKEAELNNEFTYHRVFKGKEGVIQSKSIDHSTLGVALEANMEVR